MKPLTFSLREVREKGRLRHDGSMPEDDYQEALAGMAELRGPITVELNLELVDGSVVLGGALRGRWELPCKRCLTPRVEDFQTPLEGEFGREIEELDASEEIRQTLVLAVPLQSLCSPECRGLCPRCGANLNLGECRAHA